MARPRGVPGAAAARAHAMCAPGRCGAAIVFLCLAITTGVRAQGTRETMIFLVPSTRTTPSGAPSFGAAVHAGDSARPRTSVGLVFGLGRAFEGGVRVDDVFSSASDTSGLEGALKVRVIGGWRWRVAIAALGRRSLSERGPAPAYGGGARMTWAAARAAVTVAADGWMRGGPEVGAAVEHAVGSWAVLAVEARSRRSVREAMLSLRLGLGANATVSAGAGIQRLRAGAPPTLVGAVAIGIVPRDAYLVPRAPRARPARVDSVVAPVEVARAVPDLAAVLAREQAEDSTQRARVVVPLVAAPVGPAGGIVLWRWTPAGTAGAPLADDVRALAALVLAGRCPAALDARIESGADAVPGRLDAVRRILLLLGVTPERISLLRDEEAGDTIVVRLSDSGSAICPGQEPRER